MRVDVDVDGLVRALGRFLPALDNRLRAAAREIAYRIRDRAKGTHRYVDRSGDLTRSIREGQVTGSIFEANGLVIDVVAGGVVGETSVLYAPYIEYGTRTIQERRFLRDALDYVQNQTATKRLIDEAVASAVRDAFRP